MDNTTERYTPQVEQALRRWMVIWEESLDNASLNSFGFRFEGPEVSVAFLDDEIALGRLNNDQARKLHSRQLKLLNIPLLPGSAQLRAVLTPLAQHVLKGRSEYVASLIKAAKRQFAEGLLQDAIVQEMRSLLTGGTAFASQDGRVAWLSQQLIVGYHFRGLDRSKIRELLRKTFFHREHFVDDTVYTDYPLTNTKDWRLPGFERPAKQHNEELLAELAVITLEDRFATLCREHERPRQLTFIFPIRGLKGLVPLELGRVKIYPPAHQKMVAVGTSDGESDIDLEMFNRTEKDALNAAITLDATNSDKDRQAAMRIIRAMLDVLVMYVPTRAPITLDTEQCTIVNTDGSLAGSAYSRRGYNDDVLHAYIAPDLNQILSHPAVLKAQVAATELNPRARGAAPQQRIGTALGAFRKANEGDDPEDRLLNYWVSIEAMLSTSGRDGILIQDPTGETAETLACEIIPAMFVVASRTMIGWELLHYLRALQNNAQFNGLATFENVPDHLMNRAQIPFVPWATLAIEPFISSLDELYRVFDAESVIAARIDFTRRIYRDNAAAKKELFARKQRAQDDVITIYQVRNRIVHSAFHDTAGMEYIVPAAQQYAGRLLGALLEEVMVPGAEILARSISDCGRIMARLDDEEHFDLLAEEF